MRSTRVRRRATPGLLGLGMMALLLAAAQGEAPPPAGANATASGSVQDADSLLVVDCLLPAKIRKIGRKLTYLAPRKPIKTTGLDCEIRGGEYVAHDRADYRTALRVWKEAAEAGDAPARNYVGEIYERGLGTAPDYAAAAHWYGLAAEQGYAPAQINLGQLYERGRGVPRDMRTAIQWYRRASGLDDAALPFVSSPDDAEEIARLKTALVESHGAGDALRAEMERLQQELARVSEERNSGDEAVERERSRLGSERRELARVRRELEDARGHIAEQAAGLEAERRTLEGQRANATTSAEILEKRLADQAAALERRERELVAERGALASREASVSQREQEVEKRTAEVESRRERLAALDAEVARLRGLVEERRADVRGSDTDRAATLGSRLPPVEFGRYHALVIGNNAYGSLPPLRSARRDAEAVSTLLKERYGFAVTTLYDATRYEILSALNGLRRTLNEEDNLLIYYAGHGELDEANQRGHWLPVDAEADSTANWISNVSLTDILNAMSPRHVLVIADSCYSGTLTRSVLARLEAGLTDEARSKWIETMATKRSRTALTAGGLAPVVDDVGGHSVFARALLRALEANQEVLEGQRLYQEVAARVIHGVDATPIKQVPEYSPIRFAGHESGEFFFVPTVLASR